MSKLMQNQVKIRKIRELRGYSQDYMAVQLGISCKRYSRIECGETKITLERLEQICGIFNITLGDFLSFEISDFFKKKF
ncbi:MAG: helix-turn-helix transcriptional regulator [Flavobacteriales bacterium]|nr:helix-turn-helix transcriptional regulator [Flavobacteriales bacterium]